MYDGVFVEHRLPIFPWDVEAKVPFPINVTMVNQQEYMQKMCDHILIFSVNLFISAACNLWSMNSVYQPSFDRQGKLGTPLTMSEYLC